MALKIDAMKLVEPGQHKFKKNLTSNNESPDKNGPKTLLKMICAKELN